MSVKATSDVDYSTSAVRLALFCTDGGKELPKQTAKFVIFQEFKFMVMIVCH